MGGWPRIFITGATTRALLSHFSRRMMDGSAEAILQSAGIQVADGMKTWKRLCFLLTSDEFSTFSTI